MIVCSNTKVHTQAISMYKHILMYFTSWHNLTKIEQGDGVNYIEMVPPKYLYLAHKILKLSIREK